MANVVLIGWYGRGNLGDDALLWVLLQWLTQDQSSHRIYVTGKVRPYLFHTYPQLSPVEQLQSEASVVYGGGTQWFSFRDQQSGSLMYGVGHTPISQDRRQVGAVGVGLGPFSDAVMQMDARRRLSACSLLAVRDPVSLQLCHTWGLSQAKLFPDLTFWLAAQGMPCRPGPVTVRRISVVVRDWPVDLQKMQYLRALLEFAREWRSTGGEVQFFHFQSEGDSFCRQFLARHGYDVVSWKIAGNPPSSFLDSWTEADLIITSRAHGALLAAVCGIPCICIELEPKLRIIADLLGVGALALPATATSREILTAVTDMGASIANRSQALRRLTASNVQKLEELRREFLQWLSEKPAAIAL